MRLNSIYQTSLDSFAEKYTIRHLSKNRSRMLKRIVEKESFIHDMTV